MTSRITGASGDPGRSWIPAGVPDSVADELVRNVEVEDRIVRDALAHVGEPMPDPHHLPLHGRTENEILASAGQPARRHVYVPVGTPVVTGPTDVDTWIVVGASNGNTLHLAQRSADGSALSTARRGWAELVARNPQLMDAPLRDAMGDHWVVSNADDAARLGHQAPARIVSVTDAIVSQMIGTRPSEMTTTWGDIVQATGLDQRVAEVTRPQSAMGAALVRDIIGGDHQFVTSSIGEPYGLRDTLLGTDAVQGRAGAVLDDAQKMQDWFHRVVGIDIWGPKVEALFTTDKQAFIANAAASAIGGDAFTYEGPRSPRVRGDWLGGANGKEGQFLRRVNAMIRANDLAVRTHEAGHVATLLEWGQPFERIPTSAAWTVGAEDSIVQEAISDLLGAARRGKPTVGVRDLGRLSNGWGSYQQLHELMARSTAETFDVHVGTQLLTKPMQRVLEQFGGDHMAEITGSAIRSIGHQIKSGAATSVSLPMAAKALRDATAWRHGLDSAVVRHLDEAWWALGVLRLAR